jgi:hypothetical protein
MISIAYNIWSMTPTAEYPRSRYVAMQVVLFFVLLATVALAHWISLRHVTVATPIGPIVLGDFTLRVPQDWAITRKQNNKSLEIIATEPDDTGRQVSVVFQELNAPIPPMDYLLRSGLVSGTWRGEQMTVDDNPGEYIEMTRVMESDGQRILVKDLLACIMLPNGQVISLQLTGPGRVNENDEQLMQQLLTDMQIKPQKRTAAPPPPASQQWDGI